MGLSSILVVLFKSQFSSCSSSSSSSWVSFLLTMLDGLWFNHSRCIWDLSFSLLLLLVCIGVGGGSLPWIAECIICPNKSAICYFGPPSVYQCVYFSLFYPDVRSSFFLSFSFYLVVSLSIGFGGVSLPLIAECIVWPSKYAAAMVKCFLYSTLNFFMTVPLCTNCSLFMIWT